jgi:hypothetical protein
MGALKQRVSLPPALVLILLSVVYHVLFQYLRVAKYRDPTSYSFETSLAYERIYISDRTVEEIFPQLYRPSDAINKCVDVTTLVRRGEQYVWPTIESPSLKVSPSKSGQHLPQYSLVTLAHRSIQYLARSVVP